MKEMIERLIADGWTHIEKHRIKSRCILVKKESLSENINDTITVITKDVPIAIFGNLNFTEKYIDLKTLLVDDEEDSEGEHQKIVQKEIASLLEKNYSFLIRDFEEDVIAVTEDGKRVEYNVSCFLSKHCTTKYEKVYLKDLVKKRKVKKSVWFAVDEYGDICITETKPNRENHYWINNDGLPACNFSSKVLNMSWKDEPKLITMR